METLSASLFFCEGIQKILVYSPYKGPVMWSFDVFFVVSEQAVEQIVKLPVIWEPLPYMIIFMWHQRNYTLCCEDSKTMLLPWIMTFPS